MPGVVEEIAVPRAAPATGAGLDGTRNRLEQRVAALMGGVGAVAVSSHAAALHLAIVTVASQGGHLVADDSIGDARRGLLERTLPRLGVQTRFVAASDANAWRRAAGDHTRMFIADAVSARAGALDIPSVAAVAHEVGVPLLADASADCGDPRQLFEQGADLALHAARGCLTGSPRIRGGVLIDNGRFDWDRSGRFPELTGSAGGDAYTEENAVAAMILRAQRELLPDLGVAMAPDTAAAILDALPTLGARLERHRRNAHAALDFLREHAPRSWLHPSAARHHSARPAAAGPPDHADRRAAGCPLLCLELPGAAAAAAFIGRLHVFRPEPAIGCWHSTVAQLPPDPQAARGAGATGADRPVLVRLWIGLENPAEITEDLARGLRAVAGHSS